MKPDIPQKDCLLSTYHPGGINPQIAWRGRWGVAVRSQRVVNAPRPDPLIRSQFSGGVLMPMPLKFTERAISVMKESLGKRERESEQVIRLRIDSQGEISLALDVPRDGDQRVEHQGDIVLVLEPGICVMLSEVIVDVEESD